ncbi:MAG: PorV/PorQ family protein [Candidatus Krumholzibacteria bacterium]|nr:PorV/PorQ family protein [Candidatus Krumholzibacteria bacterium]
MKKTFLKFLPRKKSESTVVSIFLIALLAQAAPAADGPGTAGALYLSLPVGPKSIAMGEASAALRGDPFGWISNPGLLVQAEGTGIGIFHSQWLLDTYYDNVFLSHRPHRMLSVGAALTYLSSPEVQGFNEAGDPTEMLDNNSFQGILGLCFTPVDNFGAGINVKYFQEKIADYTASGAGVDIGAVYTFPFPSISIGASVRNIGPKIRFISHDEELPMTIIVGGSWNRAVMPGVLGLTLAADLVKPSHTDASPALGAELCFRDLVSLRAGYCGEEDREYTGFTAGGGVNILGKLAVDYAWTPYGDLGNFHRVSIYFNR